MPNKICPKCGWALDIRDPRHTCPICHTIIKTGTCRHCGVQTTDLVNNSMLCRKCYNEEQSRLATARYHAHNAELDETYRDWLRLTTALPFKQLTEEEWLNACRYFNGCAFCGSDSIDARCYFVDFKEGGRYTRWNIIPACDKCATKLKMQPNPFRRISDSIQLRKPVTDDWDKHLEVIVGYLKLMMPKET